MLRLTGSEQAVSEVAATAEHVASLTAAAAAFQLPADSTGYPTDPSGTAITLLDERSVPEAVETLGEIGAWARDALGSDQMPSLWRALAHRPPPPCDRLAKATARPERRRPRRAHEGLRSLAVAQFRQSPYLVAYLGGLLRHSFGVDDGALVELAAMTMHALAFNTIAGGILLEAPFDELAAADFVPGGRVERARRPGEPSWPVTPSNRG